MELSIGELAKASGVTRRTIRYYVELGLLPPPEGAGRAAVYGDEHLERLRRIQELQATRLSLEEIRDHLAAGPQPAYAAPAPHRMAATEALGDAPSSAAQYLGELRQQLYRAPPGPAPPSSKPATEPFVGEPWVRIPLTPDIELHVRRRGSRLNRSLPRLIKAVQRILSEEEPQ